MQKYVPRINVPPQIRICKSYRSRQELSNEYLLAKLGVDTAENEPLKVTDSAAGENTELVVSRLRKVDIVDASLNLIH